MKAYTYKRWSQEELARLLDLSYDHSLEEALAFFPDRTPRSLKAKLQVIRRQRKCDGLKFPKTPKHYYSVEECLFILDVKRYKFNYWAKKNNLKCLTIGKRRFYHRNSLVCLANRVKAFNHVTTDMLSGI